MRHGDGNSFVLTMLALGSVCGLVEVIVKGVLHHLGLHLSGLLIGLDCILIGIGMAMFRNPLMIIGMGVVTCICKQLVVPLHGVSFMCGANGCLAVMLGYGSLAVIAAFTLWRMVNNITSRMLTGGSGVFLGSIIFYFVGMHVNPCPYLLTFDVPGGFASFVAKEGVVWAAFSAALFPLGWSFGERLAEKPLVRETPSYYMKAGVTTVICLAASGLFISLQG